MIPADPRAFLRTCFDAALAVANPMWVVPPHLPAVPKGRTLVIGAGKAASAMAAAVESHWPADALLAGLVVTAYSHSVPTSRIETVEAGHPVPDANGVAAAARLVGLLDGLTADDLVLALFSGGGSSLLAAPTPGISLGAKQAVTRALLKAGAPISAINCVRKHLSAVKGGRLAALAHPARVLCLIVSDVPGDDPATIASGPFAPDATTCEEALTALARYRIVLPPGVKRWLDDPASETPKPGDPVFAGIETRIVARAEDALLAAAAHASAAGVTPLILSDAMEGESREVAKVHAAIARQIALYGEPAPAPALLLSGGETTVTVTGNGKGGRNSEFALALALALNGRTNVYALAADTDGIDGTETNAGAFVAPDTLARARAVRCDGAAHLARNDSYAFFQALGDLIETGPTRTNVNDFRAVLIAKL